MTIQLNIQWPFSEIYNGYSARCIMAIQLHNGHSARYIMAIQ